MNSELSDTRKISNSEEKSGTNSPFSSPFKDRLIGTKEFSLLNNENNNFNNFQFWRTPLPEIEVDLDVRFTLNLRTNLENRKNIQLLENEEKIYSFSFENENNLYLLENEQPHSLENVGGSQSFKSVQPYPLESEENPHSIESEQSDSLENVENSHSLRNEQQHSLENEKNTYSSESEQTHSLENEESPPASENKAHFVENEVKSHCDTKSGSTSTELNSKYALFCLLICLFTVIQYFNESIKVYTYACL